MTCKRPRSKKIEQASPVIMVSQKNKKKQPTSNKHSTWECLKAESSLLSAATWVFTNICRFPPMRPKFPLCFPWEQQQQQHWDRDETTFQANKVSIKKCVRILMSHTDLPHTLQKSRQLRCIKNQQLITASLNEMKYLVQKKKNP